ncbi:hypothetical protein TNCV_2447531 [Trichonephila clavipes]|uniref:Uncharacterized protein n=1 Tax=Trichonephila clavipes TaxID=2585209 RepID=A0A8X6VBU7_TRICX|nr:hypothetical protein TNCV_2447531 [Trichonephila clavipes]
MTDCKSFHRLYIETRLFHVTRHDAGQRKAVVNSSLEESFLNFVADRQKSSTRYVTHHISVHHQTVCSVKQKPLTPLSFSTSTSFESSRLSSPTNS